MFTKSSESINTSRLINLAYETYRDNPGPAIIAKLLTILQNSDELTLYARLDGGLRQLGYLKNHRWTATDIWVPAKELMQHTMLVFNKILWEPFKDFSLEDHSSAFLLESLLQLLYFSCQAKNKELGFGAIWQTLKDVTKNSLRTIVNTSEELHLKMPNNNAPQSVLHLTPNDLRAQYAAPQSVLHLTPNDLRAQHSNDVDLTIKLVKASLDLTYGIFDVAECLKLDCGLVTLNKTLFSLRDLLDECRQIVPFQLNITEAVPQDIYSDRSYLKQIFISLLKNAEQHGKQPISINIDAMLIDLASEDQFRENSLRSDKFSLYGVNFQYMLTINVVDQGTGILADKIAQIFHRDSPGIGLRLCSGLIKLLGGTLTYIPVAKGANFQLEIPVTDAVPMVSKQPFINRRVTVLGHKLLAARLKYFGCFVQYISCIEQLPLLEQFDVLAGLQSQITKVELGFGYKMCSFPEQFTDELIIDTLLEPVEDILIIDENPISRASLQKMLKSINLIKTTITTTSLTAHQIITQQKKKFLAIILDLPRSKQGGLDFAKQIINYYHRQRLKCPIIVIVSNDEIELGDIAEYIYLVGKPYSLDDLKRILFS
jgi:CheY-like chemotaxis protein